MTMANAPFARQNGTASQRTPRLVFDSVPLRSLYEKRPANQRISVSDKLFKPDEIVQDKLPSTEGKCDNPPRGIWIRD